MGRGVGGSNLGQTQAELSGLNRVFHELGPPDLKIDFPDTYLAWKSNFQYVLRTFSESRIWKFDFPDTYLVKFQTKYVLKIRLSD